MVYASGVHCQISHCSTQPNADPNPIKEHNPWASTSAKGCDIRITKPQKLDVVLSFPKEINTPGKLFDLLAQGDPASIPKEPIEGFEIKLKVDGVPLGKPLFFRPGAPLKPFFRKRLCDPEQTMRKKGKIDVTMSLLPPTNNGKPYEVFCFYYTYTGKEQQREGRKSREERRDRERWETDRDRYQPVIAVSSDYYTPVEERPIEYPRAGTPPTVKLNRIEAENRELELEVLDLTSLIEKEKLAQARLRDIRQPPSTAYPSYPSQGGYPTAPTRRCSVSPPRGVDSRGAGRGGYPDRYPEDPRYSAYPSPPVAASLPPTDLYSRISAAPSDVGSGYYPGGRDDYDRRERHLVGYTGRGGR